MTHGGWSSPSPCIRSRLTRRQLVQRAPWRAPGDRDFAPAACRAGRERNQLWAAGTLDIGDDGWKIFANESGVKVDFTDNGNDPGPSWPDWQPAMPTPFTMLEAHGGTERSWRNAV